MAAKEGFNQYGLIPANPDNAHIGYYPVATTQTIAKNDPVILSSGQIAIAEITSAELCGSAAEASVSAAAGTLIAIFDDPDTPFHIRADADASSATIGAEFDLDGSTGAFQLDVGGTTYDVLTLLGTKTGDTNSETGAHMTVKINKHAFADQS